MVKATIVYDLEDFGDHVSHRRAMKADAYIGVLNEMYYFLRNRIKYPREAMDKKEFEAFEEIQGHFLESLRDNNIDIFEE